MEMEKCVRSPVQVISGFVEILWPRRFCFRVTLDTSATAAFPPMIHRVTVKAERQMTPLHVVKASHFAFAYPRLPIAR